MLERKALIFNIQKYNMYDGPGIRTMVFFKGCPLRCKWCSNPESQSRKFQVLVKQDLCVDCGACVSVCPAGVHRMAPSTGRHEIVPGSECIGCLKCEAACTVGALAVAGKEMTISELVDIVEEDRPFYETSGGGLTLGGGEALMQPEAAVNLLMACRQRGINTAIETCGYAKPEVVMKTAEFTDLFLYDVKHMDAVLHHEWTGVHNGQILSNLALLLENRRNVKIRIPLLKGVNDGDSNMQALVNFLHPYLGDKNFKGIDLLPYHKLGVYKYKQLGMEYGVSGNRSFSDGELEKIERNLRQYTPRVSVIRH